MTEKERARLKEGERLHNSGFFFEAHEVWEEVWKKTGGKDKIVLQGLIQAAAGFHKLKEGQPEGAAKLLKRSCSKISGNPQLKDYGQALKSCIAAIEAGRSEKAAVPNLNFFS